MLLPLPCKAPRLFKAGVNYLEWKHTLEQEMREAEETLDMTSISSHLPGNAFCSQTGQNCGGSLFRMKRRTFLGSLPVGSGVIWQQALEWRAVRWPFPTTGAAMWGWWHVTSFPLILRWKSTNVLPKSVNQTLLIKPQRARFPSKNEIFSPRLKLTVNHPAPDAVFWSQK